MTPLERAARALCHQAGNPTDTKFEGKPMWHSYLPEARAAVVAMRLSPPGGVDPAIYEATIDAILEEG